MGEVIKLVGNDIASQIGILYCKGRENLREAGQMLLEQKEGMAHGEWLPWLRANEKLLGFGVSTANRLMKLCVNAEFDLWGNDSQRIQQSLSNEHYTPRMYVDAARSVMGEIDLDPASCGEANKIVSAKAFFDEKANGLKRDWIGRVWLNPPYGDMPGLFVKKLFDEMGEGRVTQAVVLVNAHCTDANWFRPLWDGTICFTDHRINFYGDERRSGSTHGSMFAYFGKRSENFGRTFAKFGPILHRIG